MGKHAEVNVTANVHAREDGSLSSIEKRLDDLSDIEIGVKIKDIEKELKAIDKLFKGKEDKRPLAAEELIKKAKEELVQLKEIQNARKEIAKIKPPDTVKQIKEEVDETKKLAGEQKKLANAQNTAIESYKKSYQKVLDMKKAIYSNKDVQNPEYEVELQLDRLKSAMRKDYKAVLEYQKMIRDGISESQDLYSDRLGTFATADLLAEYKGQLAGYYKGLKELGGDFTWKDTDKQTDSQYNGMMRIIAAQERQYINANKLLETTSKQTKAIERQNIAQDKQLMLTKAKNKDGIVIPQQYTAVNGKYRIDKGTVGWNLYETDSRGIEQFITSYRTLNELRKDSGLIAEQEAEVTNKQAEAQKKLNEQIMKYVPKSKKDAIQDAYKDDDGYWLTLKEGFEASNTDSGARTIHSDTIKDLKYQTAGIRELTSARREDKEAMNQQSEAAQQATGAIKALGDADENASTGFSAERTVEEIKKISEAADAARAGLKGIQNPGDLQGSIKKYIDNLDGKKFKFIAADINEVADGIDTAVIHLQSLEDESVHLMQTWAMIDGELSLGKIKTRIGPVNEKVIDEERINALKNLATSRLGNLKAELDGVDGAAQKFNAELGALEASISSIGSNDAFKTWNLNLEAARNNVGAFKKELRTIGSLGNTIQNTQNRMANADNYVIGGKADLSKYIDTAGYEKVLETANNMEAAVTKYKNAIKALNDPKTKGTEQEVAAVKNMTDAAQEYDKLKQQFISEFGTLKKIAGADNRASVFDDAPKKIQEYKDALDDLGNIPGVEKGTAALQDMQKAWDNFSKADSTDFDAKARAAEEFADAQKKLSDTMKDIHDGVLPPNDNSNGPPNKNIQEYYKELLDTVNQLNQVNSKLNPLKQKDAGSGIYSNMIDQLESQKSTLIDRLHSIGQELGESFNDGMLGNNQYELPFTNILKDVDGSDAFSNITNFFNDARTQVALTTDQINEFVASLQKSQNIDWESASKIGEQLQRVTDINSKVNEQMQNGNLSIDSDMIQKLSVMGNVLKEYRSKLSKDASQWSAEEIGNIQQMVDAYEKYGNTVIKTANAESKYFQGKQKFSQNGDSFVQQTAAASEASQTIENQRQQLESFVQSITNGEGIITNFTTSANGISKIDYSVLDKATNSFQTFSAEMGRATNDIFRTETTLKNLTAGTDAAQNAIAKISSTIQNLQSNGADMGQANIQNLINLQKELANVMAQQPENMSDSEYQTMLSNMAKQANISTAELDKLVKKHQELQSLLDSGDGTKIGSVNNMANVYSQMKQAVEAYADSQRGVVLEMGNFNAANNTMSFSLTNANNEVTTMKASMDALSGSIVMQTTGVKELGSFWGQFKGNFSTFAGQFAKFAVGGNMMYKAISQFKQGVTYVKEIDSAMTELKKVTDESDATYSRFLSNAESQASSIGTTMKSFIESTSDFARLGYSIEEATELSKVANIYKNVGDGIKDVGEASDSVISTMKAFGIEADNAMGIVDKFNEVKFCLPPYMVTYM